MNSEAEVAADLRLKPEKQKGRVRAEGLEPSPPKGPGPKPGASAVSATLACGQCRTNGAAHPSELRLSMSSSATGAAKRYP